MTLYEAGDGPAVRNRYQLYDEKKDETPEAMNTP
jgi:hypothetical protein